MRSRLGSLVLLLALLVPGAARAQTATTATREPSAPGPAEVARSFFDALAARRWRDAVAYVDTAAFEMVRRDELARAWQMRNAALASTPDVTPEKMIQSLMQSDPKMPRAAAEYFVQQMREPRARSRDFIGEHYARVPSADSLEKLSTVEAAARWLEARDPRFPFRQLRDEMRARGCPERPGDAELDRPRPRAVIGAVVEGDTTAYVLYRDPERDAALRGSRGSWYTATPAVLPLRRVAKQWRVRLGGETLRSFDGVVMMAADEDCAAKQ